MSDCDSDTSVTGKSMIKTKDVENTLRQVVRDLQLAGKSNELTVNNVRSLAAGRLAFDDGFFGSGDWKKKSKEIIKDQANKEVRENSEPRDTPTKSRKRKSPDSDRPVREQQHNEFKKRLTDNKRRSRSREVVRSDGTSNKNDRNHIQKPQSDCERVADSNGESPLSDLESGENTGRNLPTGNGDASESEMSVLIDDPPPKKRAKKGDKSATKAGKSSKATTDIVSIANTDQEEIKRLQGWLVKCGIRKLWGKELAPYGSSKAKVRHLKEMLSDAGMTGRFSQEKARQIKESRELAADLEAVQEGNKIWGKGADDNDNDNGDENNEGSAKPRRRLAKGLKELDFISDEDSD